MSMVVGKQCMGCEGILGRRMRSLRVRTQRRESLLELGLRKEDRLSSEEL